MNNGLTIDATPSGRNGSATLTARLGDEVLAVEKLNLAKPKARAQTLSTGLRWPRWNRPAGGGSRVAAIGGRPGGEARGPGGNGGKARRGRPVGENARDRVRIEARTLLDAPNLMQRVVEDIGALGVAGEKELAATVYLIGTSRLLPEPTCGDRARPIIIGQELRRQKAASLFPPEAVITATQLTPQALFYMQPGSLVHRFIVAGERSRLENDDTAEATRALREMLSEGRLSKLLPIKKDGQLETVLVEQDGPIAYVETTTLTKLFNEDANRCILLDQR